VVDDDKKTRAALCMLVDGAQGFACVGAFATVAEAVRQLPGDPPDVVLLDLDLGNGIAAIREGFPRAAVLVLAVFEDEGRILRSLRSGASGYLLKTTPPDSLLRRLAEAASGGVPISPGIAAGILHLLGTSSMPLPTGTRLTAPESCLLDLLAQGHGYREAATRLGVTVDAVHRRVRSIYAKLHLQPDLAR
jgi:DNA-binding NarL/FixJ family response regulator